ncbi:hypothetical protein [uncultured Chitinophaga sp.]|nr:hypothetical protein [uncultured Chitinophaga sp.]
MKKSIAAALILLSSAACTQNAPAATADLGKGLLEIFDARLKYYK